MRLVSSTRDMQVLAATVDADYCIIDATQCPEEAMPILSAAVELVGPKHVAVYTEVMHDGLEVAVREQGVLFYSGRMTDDQWDAFMPRTEDEPPWVSC